MLIKCNVITLKILRIDFAGVGAVWIEIRSGHQLNLRRSFMAYLVAPCIYQIGWLD